MYSVNPLLFTTDCVVSIAIFFVLDDLIASFSGGNTYSTFLPNLLPSMSDGVFDAITTRSGENCSLSILTDFVIIRESSNFDFFPYGKFF